MKLFKLLCCILCMVNATGFAQAVSKEQLPDSAKSSIELSINAGGGLVRNTLAPEFDFSASVDLRKRIRVGLILTSFYLFDRGENGWKMNDHYLIGPEFTFNSFFFSLFPDKESKRSGLGFAFLVGRKGDYFTGTTMKFYLIDDHPGVRLRPELWMTDNFKTFFPGIAVIF